MTHFLRPEESSRRAFLRSAALAAIAPTALSRLSAAETADDDETNGFIDAHVHVWTPDVEQYPLAKGAKREDMVPPSFTPKQLFAHCRPQGVDRVVLIQMIFYGFDNSYMLDSIADHPSEFRGVAIIDEKRPDACNEMRRLKKKGVRGFRLYADKTAAESWLDSPAMKAMWTCGADEGLAMCLLANPDALPAVYKLCAKFPKTSVVVDHFARIGMQGPVQQADLDYLCRLADFEQTFVKTSAFYALGKKQTPYTDLAPMIRKLRDVYGADRLMWATDCPYQVEDGHTYADSIALIRDRLDFLTDDDKAWMLRKTAERVFFG
ncbi:MAG: amidohydrolase family protein [Planctomycetaceae bacterium]